MARPRKVGEAYVTLHADSDPFIREAQEGIQEGAERAEDDLKETGDEWGETLAEAMGDRLEKEGPQLARSVERGIGKQKIKVPINAEYQRDRDGVRRLVSKVTSEIEEAVLEAGTAGPGGPFGKIGQAFADAIGAGFNVSGRSPLIAFLLPLIGAIVGVVIAAIQALNALVAVAITLPGILAAIGIQVGVLMIAFQGVGTAIEGAFAAKNAKELNEALKPLAPAAREFVKELLPLKEFWRQLNLTVQQNFFQEITGLITELRKWQGNRVLSGFQAVATAMGKFFHDLGFFFNSDSFTKFLDEVFPRTVTFLEQFGPSFITFLQGVVDLANAAMPFMTEVGGILSRVFKQLGDFFTETANDPEFQQWLSDMKDTLDEVVTLIKSAAIFIGALMTSINEAGGEDLITQLSESLLLIADFLSSDVGKKAIEAFINIAMFSIQVVTGLIIAILAIAGAAQKVGEYVKESLLGDVGGFFSFIWEKITWFFGAAANRVAEFFAMLWRILSEGRTAFNNFATAVKDKVTLAIDNVVALVKAVPDKIKNFFSDAIGWLWQAGKNVIQGFINGIMGMLNPLGNVMHMVAQRVRDNVPSSPAKEGPLSGKGDTLYAGQKIVQRLATGMEMEIPRLRDASAEATSNIVFGPNSIQMRINGTMDRDQARDAGEGVAEGIWGSLMGRNTKLAIRTL